MNKWLAILGCMLLFRTAPAQVSAFPDSDPGSGRFVNVTRGLSSLGDVSTRFQVESIGSNLNLGIFDGDLGGKWDVPGTDTVRFTLYEDPTGLGATAIPVGSWLSSSLSDNSWTEIVMTNSPGAQVGNRYIYNLVVSWETNLSTNEQNNFKLKVESGYVFVPANTTFEVIGYTPNDPNPAMFGPTTYDGTWNFKIATGIGTLSIWDGDFDRADDDNDLASPKYPTFPYSPNTYPQMAWPGAPADDGDVLSPLTVSPAIYYTVTLPDGSVQTKVNPSGNREWELLQAPTTLGGDALLKIVGADGRNTLFLNISAPVYGEVVEKKCGPTRSMGYWQTHPDALIEAVELGVNLGKIPVCSGYQDLRVADIHELEAIFWGSPSQASQLGKARLALAHQLIAAIANVKVLGAEEPVSLFADARLALAGTNQSTMRVLASLLEDFNLSREDIDLPAGMNFPADPSRAKSLATKRCGKIYPGLAFK